MINQDLSLVIPRVFPQWIDEAKIFKVFRDQQIGIISKVSIVRMPNEKGRNHPIYKAYLYFSVWFENIIAQNFQDRIYGKNKQARIVYDDPWFWTVFENKERVRLSKVDKRMMRLSAEMYKNWLFIQEQLQEQQEQQEQQEEIFNKIKEQNQKLSEQNNTIQKLQDFCIQNGLEIPFWSAKYPPSAEVSSLETLSATTAVACANFALHEEQDEEQEHMHEEQEHMHEEQEHMDYYSVPYPYDREAYDREAYDREAYDHEAYDHEAYDREESVLFDDIYKLDKEKEDSEIFNYDFIPVNWYEAEWEIENPYTNNSPEQSKLCSYLGGDFQMNEMRNLPMYM